MNPFDFLSYLPLEQILDSLLSIFDGGMQVQAPWIDPTTSGFSMRISPAVNEHVLSLSDYLMDFGMKHAEKMTGVGRALGAVFAVIIAGKEAYKVMAEQKGFDVLDIMRPVLFAFVLAFWGPVVHTVTAPGIAVESHFRDLYESVNYRVDSLRQQRQYNALILDDKAREARALQKMEEEAARQGGSSWGERIVEAGKDAWNWLVDKTKMVIAVADLNLNNYIEKIIVWIGELAFTVAIYIVFVIKALFVTVLAMFGPIYMAASILPAWKDAWKQWVERMVNASLYGAMGYLAMAFSMQLVCYSLEIDIQNLDNFAKDFAKIGEYAAGTFGTCCTTAVTYFVGCFAMKAVPEMASMAFPGHASHAAVNFISGMGGTAASGAKMAASAGKG